MSSSGSGSAGSQRSATTWGRFPVKADIDAAVVYRHPIERVWAALTSSEALAAWLMPNDFVPEVGHRFTLRTRPAAASTRRSRSRSMPWTTGNEAAPAPGRFSWPRRAADAAYSGRRLSPDPRAAAAGLPGRAGGPRTRHDAR